MSRSAVRLSIRTHRLDPNPETGHSSARIARALNEAGVPCPSAAPPPRSHQRHRGGTCDACGRRMESAWSNGKPAYRCRHGRTTAMAPDPGWPKNAYLREDRILPHLPALHLS
jgi:hypothetical protein